MDKHLNGYKCLSCNINLFGQRRKWCDVDCQRKGENFTVKLCEHCKTPLPYKAKRWCSKECDARASNKTGKLWHELWKGPIKSVCICCGKTPANENAREGQRFCSYKCRGKTNSKISKESMALRKIGEAWRPKQPPKPKPLKPPKAEKALKVFTCLTCNATRNNKLQKWKKYCSPVCKPKPAKTNKNTPAYRRAKKAWRLKRKAIERGATIAEKFHPFDIFDRDGWKCQICGTKTPKALRGTYKPNAPELDHIVPISKGGVHSMSNSQTSCRSCNAAKSNKDSRGQMGLFTSLFEPRGGMSA
jgi:5-methylcytosine-specific restriction endonuclease McrA